MRSRRKKRRSYTYIWRATAVLLVVTVVGLGIYFGMQQRHRHQAIDAVTGQAVTTNVVHVMIMGVDSRDDDVGRSDTLMVAALDTERHKAALLSIPRDTRVPIEGHDYDKINHAYAFGGHKLSQQTVEKLLGVPMDHYIVVNTKAFPKLIDAIGGVDINVEKRMHYEDPWDDDGGLVIDLYPGEQHMDGKKAIQYVRYRDGEGDIGRIGRQQKFMKAVLKKMVSPDILPKLPDIIKTASTVIKTDMSVTELLDFAQQMKAIHDNGLEAKMVPGRPAYLKDISYWIPDITDLRELMRTELGLELSDEEAEKNQADEDAYNAKLPEGINMGDKSSGPASEAEEQKEEKETEPLKPQEIRVMVINDSGINGAGAEVAGILQRKGFIISNVETGRTNSREKTTITTSTRNTDVFYGMPFPCVIMDGGSRNQAVVHIGLDYGHTGRK